MEVVAETVRLTEEEAGPIELACGNGHSTKAEEAVSDILLPAHPSGSNERLSKPQTRVVGPVIAQFEEP